MKKYRVLILENSTHVTGALKSVVRTAFDLRKEFDFLFVIPRRSQGKAWIKGKSFFNIHELPFKEISKRVRALVLYVPMLISNAWRLKKIIRDERIDLVHSNDLYNLVPVMLRVLGDRTPYVCHIRFLPEKFPPLIFDTWLRLHLHYASSVIAVSEHLRKQLPRHEKIIVIHNELPVEERYPDPLPKHTAPTLLYLSNVIQGKGHQYAIEAFAKVSSEFPEWKLRFVGGDMGLNKNRLFREKLKTMVREAGIEERVTWVDFVEEVEREYKQAHITLNFSESESFSITCIEALFYGSPLIATDCGGPAEIVDHRETGLLVPSKDVASMAAAMRELMGNMSLATEMAERGKIVVRERFSIPNTSFKVKDQYLRALGDKALE